MAKRLKVGDLNRLYQEAESCDSALFAEQRSHVLLIAGDHYARRGDPKFSQVRDGRDSSDYTKLRLTKNHTHKIHKFYKQTVLSNARGVTVSPQIESEAQDQKDAELNKSIWVDAKRRYKLSPEIRKWAGDYSGIGEVAVKIFWDPDYGDFIGYEQKVDENGIPVFDLTGAPVPDEDSPRFEGGFRFERIFGFNLLRDPGAQSMDDSPYLITRKMVPIGELKLRYKDDEEKQAAITEGADETYIVFDSNKGGYERSKGMVPVREYYFRPCPDYPEGYFYIATKGVILEEGKLPLGIFPISWKGFDEHQTSPRGRSIIKQVRPYQAEINRASSSQALHQITIGDDKILYQAGTKLAPGALLPGVRGITYQGGEPKILQGRDGGQYQAYIDGQIRELYAVVDVADVMSPNQDIKGGQDLYSLLFRASSQKLQLNDYCEKFEEFLVDVVEKFLRLAPHYYPDDMVIPAIGRGELINMAEYRKTEKFRYRVVVEAQDDTLETKFGKQLTFQHLLQYAGKQLSREDIGMLMQQMPFANKAEMFKEYTVDVDAARNLILALERGEWLESIPEDNHGYIIKKLSLRMKQSDFRFLSPQIQQMFRAKRDEHMQFKAEEEQKKLALESQYIPSDGPMIACDMYVEDADPTKAPKRARVPQRALNWLIKTLEAQSGSIDQLEQMDSGALGSMAQYLGINPGAPQQPGMSPGGGAPMQAGQDRPMMGATYAG